MFKRSIRGKVTLNLKEDERKILLQLFEQMQQLLELPDVPQNPDPLALLVGLDGPTEIPSDPALARLFPAAYVDDQAAASDFRRFTEPDLRNEKLTNVELVSHLLENNSEKLELNQAQINAWLKSLNDVRLVLGTRLGISEEYREQSSTDPGLHLYDYLTFLQSTLIDSL